MATDTNWGDRLGQILMQGSRDYMNISLANQADERNRERQLSDRAQAEAGEERRFERGLTAQREDTKLARDTNFQQAILSALVQNGFLAPADVGNPEAVAAAYAKAQQSGLIKRYENLITQGLLDPKDIADPQKVNDALAKLGDITRTMTSNAQTEATRLRDESIQVQQENEQLDADLQRPAATPSDQQILSRAVQLAQQAKPGKTPSNEDIQSFAGQAAEELQQRAQIEKFQRDQAAVQRKQLLQNRAIDLQRRQENLETRFNVAPGAVPAPTPVSPSSAPSGPRQATSAERAAALREALGTATTQPGGPSAPPPPAFANTFNDPELAAFNEANQSTQLAARVQPIEDARQSAQEKIRVAQANIDRFRAAPGAVPGVGGSLAQPLSGPVMGQPQQPAAPNPRVAEARARELNRFYVALQEGQQELNQAEKALAQFQGAAKRGTTPVLAKTPSISEPVFAPPSQTPAFDSRLMLQPAM